MDKYTYFKESFEYHADLLYQTKAITHMLRKAPEYNVFKISLYGMMKTTMIEGLYTRLQLLIDGKRNGAGKKMISMLQLLKETSIYDQTIEDVLLINRFLEKKKDFLLEIKIVTESFLMQKHNGVYSNLYEQNVYDENRVTIESIKDFLDEYVLLFEKLYHLLFDVFPLNHTQYKEFLTFIDEYYSINMWGTTNIPQQFSVMGTI